MTHLIEHALELRLVDLARDEPAGCALENGVADRAGLGGVDERDAVEPLSRFRGHHCRQHRLPFHVSLPARGDGMA